VSAFNGNTPLASARRCAQRMCLGRMTNEAYGLLDVNARISRGKNRISNGCYFPIRTTFETAHHPRRTATPFMGLCDCWNPFVHRRAVLFDGYVSSPCHFGSTHQRGLIATGPHPRSSALGCKRARWEATSPFDTLANVVTRRLATLIVSALEQAYLVESKLLVSRYGCAPRC
jgi:hypothetical protein